MAEALRLLDDPECQHSFGGSNPLWSVFSRRVQDQQKHGISKDTAQKNSKIDGCRTATSHEAFKLKWQVEQMRALDS